MTGTRMLPFTVLLIITVAVQSTHGELSPILVVPGFGGCQLEAKISDGSSCDTNGQWMRYWANIGISADCVNKVLQLQYDDANNAYSNLQGIEVNVPGFGDTDTVEYLNPDYPELSGYFNTFVDYFVRKGYERGKTIRAAPYDWRLAPDTLNKTGYYQSLQTLVEEMYDVSNEKVSIVVHSMGGPVTLYFFNNIVTQDWKDKYINVFVSLSGTWAGSSRTLYAYISAQLPSIFAPLGVASPSIQSSAWTVPNPDVWKDKVILTSNDTMYSANDYEELFMDVLDRETDYVKIKNALSILDGFPAPNIPTHCFYGVGLPTVEVLNYGNRLPYNYESLTFGDGDGAISTISLERCETWSDQRYTFKSQKFVNTSHEQIIAIDAVLEAVDEAIVNPSDDRSGSVGTVTDFKFLVALLVIIALMIAVL